MASLQSSAKQPRPPDLYLLYFQIPWILFFGWVWWQTPEWGNLRVGGSFASGRYGVTYFSNSLAGNDCRYNQIASNSSSVI